MNRKKVTFCTGYWEVLANDGGPARHSHEHYLTNIPLTFNLLGNSNIIFYYEDSNDVTYEKIKTFINEWDYIK